MVGPINFLSTSLMVKAWADRRSFPTDPDLDSCRSICPVLYHTVSKGIYVFHRREYVPPLSTAMPSIRTGKVMTVSLFSECRPNPFITSFADSHMECSTTSGVACSLAAQCESTAEGGYPIEASSQLCSFLHLELLSPRSCATKRRGPSVS